MEALLSNRKELLQEFIAVDCDVLVVIFAVKTDVLVQQFLTLFQRKPLDDKTELTHKFTVKIKLYLY